MLKPKHFAILIVVLLAACREEAEMLSSPEISALLAQDRKIEFERFSYSGTAHLHKDQSFDVLVPRLGQDTGTWWIEDDAICSRWRTFQQGRTLCATVGQKRDGTYQGFSPSSGAYLGDFRFTN